MIDFFLYYLLCIVRGWGSKEGSLLIQPVVQSKRELEKLLGSDDPGKHVEATKKGSSFRSNKHNLMRQNWNKLLETLIFLRPVLIN